MKRRPIIRKHFTLRQELHLRDVHGDTRVDVVRDSSGMTHIRKYIPKVIGAAPAIVFEPRESMASIRRPYRENKGWMKLQAIINGDGDRIRGYDDGEAEPQTRGVHAI